MGKISGSHCLVLGCRNRQLLNSVNLRSYFRFPRDADLCKKWVDFCDRPELYKKYDENGPEYLYKSSRICSDHFQPTDFNNPNLFSQGLKKGSVPTVNPATSDAKPSTGGGGTGGGGAGGGGGGGSGSSNGAGSPIDEKLLSAVAAIPNLSLMMAIAVNQQLTNQVANLPPNLSPNLKRTALAMSGGGTTAGATTPTTTTTTTTTPSVPSAAKRNRAVPPLAAPTGALANLIQRHQQIKEQQLKEQLRKTSALGNGQVSITPAFGLGPANNGPGTSPNRSNNNNHHGGAISLVTTKKSSANNHNNNNNNNNVTNHNHNHHHKLSSSISRGREDPSEYGLKMVDMDMTTGGESSEGDSSNQNSADEDYTYSQKLKVAKVEAVIPPSLKSQLTVTPAAPPTSNSVHGVTTINNNSIHNANANGGGTPEHHATVDYKEKYEQTLKELFACRKIVKNQNKAIKQQQVEIDFLNQLLKEK